MAYDIQFLKGLAKDLPEVRDDKIFYYTTDSHKLYLGTYELTNTGVAADLAAAITRIGNNETAISTINGNASTSGSIAYAVKALDDQLKAVAKSGEADDITVDAISGVTGTDLQTVLESLKTLIDSGGSGSVLNITKSTPGSGVAARYTFSQGGSTIATTVDIPADMVVSSGEVVTNPTGQPAGTYLVLTLANATQDKVYINVSDLIEYVTSGSQVGDMVVINIDGQHKVTATITDGTVTKAKLDSSVQTSLGKADTALQEADITTGTANGKITVGTKEVSVYGLGSAAYTDSTAYDAAGAASTAKSQVIGTSSDAASADTVYGAKAYGASAASTAAAGVVGTSSDTSTANTVYGAKAYADSVAGSATSTAETYTDTKIGALDADLDASGTTAHSGTFVMSGVVQTDGKITSIDSVEVEAAGAAASAQSAAQTYTDTKIAALDADLNASGTAAHSGTFVMSGVTEVDGKITAVDSVEVEAAGAAAAAESAAKTYADGLLTWGSFPTSGS